MTEAQWLASHYPYGMLGYLGKRPDHSDRKTRLLAVACCRRVAAWLPDPFLCDVIDACERCAEDPEPFGRLAELNHMVRDHADRMRDGGVEQEDLEFILAVAVLTEWPISAEHCPEFCRDALCGHDDMVAGQGETLFQLDLIRDIFGNPFRPVAFAPDWRTSTAVALARQMYDARDFAHMPILADALQDAGCEHPDVLAHCRDPQQVHVRGCWVVDLVLGKG